MTRMHTYLNFPGNAAEAFEFHRSVFGGELSSHVRFRDMPMEGVDIPEEDQDKAMHIDLPIGDNDLLKATDALESLGQKLEPGNNVYVSIHPRHTRGRRPHLQRAVGRRRSRDADRRPGVGRLLRRLHRLVRCQVDGEPLVTAGVKPSPES